MNATSSTTAKTIIGILAVIGALALISLLFMALMRRDEQDGQRHDAHDVDVHGCREQLGSHARQRSGHLHERQRALCPQFLQSASRTTPWLISNFNPYRSM